VKRLLLDTNVVVWLLLSDHDAVSDKAVDAMLDERNTVCLSAVSVWEIAIKRSRGQLDIEPSWMRVLSRLNFDPLPITFAHARQVEDLPWHHRDPFDRLLVAQAMLEEHALVSADPQLVKYDVEVIW
jgi:PIN domain nuclease of toxin-antitoxin system